MANVEKRVSSLENYFKLAGGVAVIFGVSGAWGYSILNTAQGQLKQLQTDIVSTRSQLEDLRNKTNLDSIRTKVTEEIHRIDDATAADLGRVRAEAGTAARTAAAAVVGDLQVPRGTIIAWPYDRTTRPIPNGWVECNGQNGTPKLSNQVIHGAGLGLNDNHPNDPIQWFVGTSDGGDRDPIQIETVNKKKMGFAPLHFTPVLFIMKL